MLKEQKKNCMFKGSLSYFMCPNSEFNFIESPSFIIVITVLNEIKTLYPCYDNREFIELQRNKKITKYTR